MLVIDKAPGSRRGLFAFTRVNKPVAISAALELGECLIFSAAFVGIAQAMALHRAMVACICFGASCGVIWQAHHSPPIISRIAISALATLISVIRRCESLYGVGLGYFPMCGSVTVQVPFDMR